MGPISSNEPQTAKRDEYQTQLMHASRATLRATSASVHMGGARQGVGMESKQKAKQADVPDLAMDCKDKGSDVQEEDSIHGFIRQAMEPPHVKHMRHRQCLHRTDTHSATHVFLSRQRPALEWQRSL